MLDAIEDRWEHGSEFQTVTSSVNCQQIQNSWNRKGIFYGSGRDALRSLLLFGQQERDWRRIWVPSYYCYEVVESIISTGIELFIYHDSMIEDHPDVPIKDIAPNDVILLVNFFGLRNKPILPPIERLEIIEDHTHDPWSKWAIASQAEFCFASLRKTLPVSDGGVLWSPLKHPIPSQPTVTQKHQAAASVKLSSMLLKKLYLKGFFVPKEKFRNQAITGEEQIASGKISGITETSKTMINCFPCLSWRGKKLENFLFFKRKVSKTLRCRILEPRSKMNCPFSIVLLLDSERCRDDLRRALIKKNIYPAVYWPLKKFIAQIKLPEDHILLSKKILSIHCDMRYDKSDMERVAEVVVRYLN